jgi:hypothetical protein
MGKKEIIDIIRQSRPEIEARYGVKRLGLFGSFVRGQAGRRSDIDILVSFQRSVSGSPFLGSGHAN